VLDFFRLSLSFPGPSQSCGLCSSSEAMGGRAGLSICRGCPVAILNLFFCVSPPAFLLMKPYLCLQTGDISRGHPSRDEGAGFFVLRSQGFLPFFCFFHHCFGFLPLSTGLSNVLSKGGYPVLIICLSSSGPQPNLPHQTRRPSTAHHPHENKPLPTKTTGVQS